MNFTVTQPPLSPSPTSAFRTVPRTGVIYVTTEAQKLGFQGPESTDWCNLGQGMPECGALPNSPPRIESAVMDDLTQEYAPVAGIRELRQAVADMYNRRFRKGQSSQYTVDNVAISSGGRVALTRVASSLSQIHLGHFLPDYTAYEELLDIFRLFSPIPIVLEEDKGYAFSSTELDREIVGRGLSAVLVSNPCNPTGHVIQGTELKQWLDVSRKRSCALIFDEFYSHYIWNESQSLSAAEFVEDVNQDPVVIIDGLTKNWRYSGWRIAWTVGPKEVIESIVSAASFLDGGASRPMQRAAIPLLTDSVIDQENAAIHQAFKIKRDHMLTRCRAMGMKISPEPQGTFYLFADVSALPASINTGMSFFRAALEQKVICVPGEFFDVNPGKRRRTHESRFSRHVRLSFGPNEKVVLEGLTRLEKMVADHQTKSR
ncbi:MAG: pyridoxal phosphate-dependent aminotransferase [Proteobacteria bacterium]|nr:MAG: pyridoxal phosphate-dependent aminotransferase [Pseudomonadota bacterium]